MPAYLKGIRSQHQQAAQQRLVTARNAAAARAAARSLKTAGGTPTPSKAQRFASLTKRLELAHTPGYQIRDRLSKAGLLPLGPGKFGKASALSVAPLSGPGYFLAKTLGNLAEAAVGAPGGIYKVGGDVVSDAGALTHGHGLDRPFFPKTRRDVSQIARATVHDFQHPLENPGYTLLDLSSAASFGAGIASRGAAAGRALAETEGGAGARAAAALARPGHQGGSLLHAPEPGTQTLRIGDVQVQRLLSRNAAARVVQRARNARLQRALDRGGTEPMLGKPGAAVEKHVSAQATFGRELRAQRRIDADLARAPLLELDRSMRHFGRGLSPAEHTALNVVAVEGVNALANPAETVARHVAMHEQWATEADAAAARQTGARAASLRQEAQANRAYAGDLRRAGKVLASPSPRFLDVTQKAIGLSHATEEELISRGLLHPSSAESRKAAVAAVYRGAEYVNPTPARLGVPSQALIRAKARVDRLQTLFERARTRATPARQAAAARFAQAQRDLVRLRRMTPKVAERGPVAQENHAMRLRQAEHDLELARAGFADTPAETMVSNPRIERIGGAVSVAKDELARLEKAAAGRVRPTGFAGADLSTAPVGSFYFPLTTRYTEGSLAGTGGVTASRTAARGAIMPPADSAYVSGLGRQFTGASVKSGKLPRAAQAVGDRYARVQKLASVHDFYDTLWRASTESKTSRWDVPIGSTAAVKTKLRELLGQVADQVHRNPDEAAVIDKRALDEFRRLVEQPSHEHLPVGATAEGVRWVDRRLIQDLGDTHVAGPVSRLADAINNPARVAALYLRPAYALNALGNAGMALITSGHLAPQTTRWALRSRKLVGDADTAKIDAAMGMSRSLAYSIGRGPLGRSSDRLAHAWNAITDGWFRRAAFYHQAAKAGFHPDRVGELLNDPANRAKLDEVIRRAKKDAVDFDSLTPLERNALRHAIYFYPWVSRGSMWALRAMVEHPHKTYTVAQLARSGEQNADRKLGHLPEWARLAGLIPLSAAHNGIANTVDPTSVWTPSTAAQAGQALVDTTKGIVGVGKGGGLSQNLSPALNLLAGEVVPGASQPSAPGLLGMLEATPQAQALRRAGVWGKPSKTYPGKGIWPAVAPLVAGGLAPRGTSVDALHTQALKELPADQRAYVGVYREREQLWKDAQALGLLKVGTRLPATLRDAYNLKAERARALSAAGLKHGQPDYQHKALAVDLGLLVKHKLATPQQAAAALKGWQPYDELAIQQARQKIWASAGRGELITYAKHSVNAAKRAKAAKS